MTLALPRRSFSSTWAAKWEHLVWVFPDDITVEFLPLRSMFSGCQALSMIPIFPVFFKRMKLYFWGGGERCALLWSSPIPQLEFSMLFSKDQNSLPVPVHLLTGWGGARQCIAQERGEMASQSELYKTNFCCHPECLVSLEAVGRSSLHIGLKYGESTWSSEINGFQWKWLKHLIKSAPLKQMTLEYLIWAGLGPHLLKCSIGTFASWTVE